MKIIKKIPGLFLVFIFAFLIRLIALDQSLWLDEAISARVVRNYSYLEIIRKFSVFDFHPPLYYLFLKFWTNIFGYKEISLRFPSLIFCFLTAFLIYQISKIIFNKKIAFWSTTFFLFNPLIVYYSQEARMYMMTTFFVTFSLYFLLKMQKLKKNLSHDFLFFILFLFLSFYTFYGVIFLIISLFFYFLYKKEYKLTFIFVLAFFLIFLIISPLFYKQLLHSKISLLKVKNWSVVLGKANVKNLILIPLKFSVGRISFYPKWLYWFVSGSFMLFLWFIIFARIKNTKEKFSNLFLYLLIFPLFLGFVFSFFTPVFSYFRFLYLLPIFSLVLAIKSGQLFYGRGRLVIFLGFLVFSLIYLLFPQFHREDWKSLSFYISSKTPVYMIISSSDPLSYYRPDLKIKDLSLLKESKSIENKIIIIPYSFDIHGIFYKKEVEKKKMKLVEVKHFRGVYFEVYQK